LNVIRKHDIIPVASILPIPQKQNKESSLKRLPGACVLSGWWLLQIKCNDFAAALDVLSLLGLRWRNRWRYAKTSTTVLEERSLHTETTLRDMALFILYFEFLKSGAAHWVCWSRRRSTEKL